MSILGNKKNILINQLKNNKGVNAAQVAKLIENYEDLSMLELKGIVSDDLYAEVDHIINFPREKSKWDSVVAIQQTTLSDIRSKINAIDEYLQLYPSGTFASDARSLKETLQNGILQKEKDEKELEANSIYISLETLPRNTESEMQSAIARLETFVSSYSESRCAADARTLISDMKCRLELLKRQRAEAAAAEAKRKEEEAIRREQEEWTKVDKDNYEALLAYRMRYAESVHLDEIDECMWKTVLADMNAGNIGRYINDWPNGKHIDDARDAMSSIEEWTEAKRSGDIFKISAYRHTHPNSMFKLDVDTMYYKLRLNELENMKESPYSYTKEDLQRFFDADVFNFYELKDEGLITEKSWEILKLDRELFPDIQSLQMENPEIATQEGCTDIYFWGTPGTGKTCLLMGLAGANGKGYSLNMKMAGGSYASALQQYVNAGVTPGRTFGNFVTTINGHVEETDKKGHVIDHKVNLVEMSGEEFAIRIADGDGVSLANMGTGVTNMLRNSNRKAFFIIVDCTCDMVNFKYVEKVKDANGNVVDERIRKRYISQLDALNKFVSMFELDANQEIMKNVEAIHFIVTKADTLGNENDRQIKACELLRDRYAGPVESLKSYCRRTQRINASTEYKPRVFTFSLGKFYLGDVFSFDNAETLQIVQAVRSVTSGYREKTWVDKLKGWIG